MFKDLTETIITIALALTLLVVTYSLFGAQLSALITQAHNQGENTQKVSSEKLDLRADGGSAIGETHQQPDQKTYREDDPWIARRTTPIKVVVLISILFCFWCIWHGIDSMNKRT